MLPKFSALGWIQFILNCVVVVFGLGIAAVGIVTADTRLKFQLLGVGLGLIGLGWALVASQVNAASIVEIKEMLTEMKNRK
jgi:hypothetical protein